MMKSWKTKTQMSESMALAVFLTLAGGFQDAYSYNCRGKVFANAQTGNLVLLGQNLAMGNWPAALHYVITGKSIGGRSSCLWRCSCWRPSG